MVVCGSLQPPNSYRNAVPSLSFAESTAIRILMSNLPRLKLPGFIDGEVESISPLISFTGSKHVRGAGGRADAREAAELENTSKDNANFNIDDPLRT